MSADLEARPDTGHADAVLVQQLRDAVEAFVLTSSQQKVADAAGMSRQAVGKFLRDARDPEYRLAVTTAESLARAIGWKLTLGPAEKP